MEKKNSSLDSVFAMLNCMVGGAILTFPVLYRTAGIVTSSIILAISGIISFITCRIYAFHMSPKDNDVQDMIRRIVGVKWQTAFRIVSGFHLVLLCIIYIDLIVDQTFTIVYYIMYHTGNSAWIANQSQFVFDKFSIQYLTLIYSIPLLLLISIKNLSFLVKLTAFGAYSCFIYFAFIVYEFTSKVSSGNINIDNINWLSWDIGKLSGGSTFAFTIHPIAMSVLKLNKNQKNNVRDVGLAYLLGFCLYQLIGVMGAFAISGLECEQTLLRCYQNQWQVLFVSIFYLYGRITVFPCTLEIARTRLLDYWFPKINKVNFKVFNIVFIIVGTIMSFLSPYIPLSLLMNFSGSIVCFFFIFALPTAIHFRCLYPEIHQLGSIHEVMTSMQSDALGTATECQHSRNYVKTKPKFLRYLIYGVINLIGVATSIYGIYACFT